MVDQLLQRRLGFVASAQLAETVLAMCVHALRCRVTLGHLFGREHVGDDEIAPRLEYEAVARRQFSRFTSG